MGGGFGDQQRHPFAWGVLVYVDLQVARIYSARGLPREWSDLTRLEKWMRDQGFWYWWMRNDLESLGAGALAVAEEEDPAAENITIESQDVGNSYRQDATHMFDPLSREQAENSN
jgi:hypothetical protein